MSDRVRDIIDEAIAWHVRLAAAPAEDWHSFVAWLEADEAHRDAYDRIAADDAALVVPPAPIANDDAPTRRPMVGWLGAGAAMVAAMLLAMLIVPGLMPSDDIYAVETAPGQTRKIALADGTSIEMNGGTRIRLNRDDARYAELDSGEATFNVRHDADHPFELVSGRFRVRDLGTVFNVARDGPRLGVDVAEGAVMFQPDAQAVTLTQGMGLSIHDVQTRPALHRIPKESVGGWRRGLLDFHDMPVDLVARAVGRSTGVRISLDDGLAHRRFTGSIHLTAAPEVVIPRLAALIGADWKYQGGSWMLTTRSDGGR